MPVWSVRPFLWVAAFWDLHKVGGARELSGLFVKGPNPIHGAEPPNHFPKAPPPNVIALGVRFHYMKFEGTQRDHSQTLWKKFNTSCFYITV